MIKINGQKYDYQEKKLLELLEEQGHRPEMVAVELNEEMVPREKFPETVFHDGDVVEIFSKDYKSIRERTEARFSNSLNQICAPTVFMPKDGKVIGKHIGVQYYTIGQRHGLNIGGHQESIFIIGTDIHSNTIYVGEGKEFPGLFRNGLHA